jgi:hypothetical protein
LAQALKHDYRRTVYLTDSEYSDYLRLFAASPHRSESAFLAELLAIGADVKRRQQTADVGILDAAA